MKNLALSPLATSNKSTVGQSAVWETIMKPPSYARRVARWLMGAGMGVGPAMAFLVTGAGTSVGAIAGAFLIAHGIAEDAPEQPDVVAQPRVFFKRLGFLGAIGLLVGVGRHDLGRHGWLLQKLPGSLLSRNFSPATQVQEEGGSSGR